jgi:hypothetical protein
MAMAFIAPMCIQTQVGFSAQIGPCQWRTTSLEINRTCRAGTLEKIVVYSLENRLPGQGHSNRITLNQTSTQKRLETDGSKPIL